MQREEALKLLKENVSNLNLVKHCLAVEAVMLALAQRFGQDQEKWALAGLLHDIDYDKVKDDLSQHTLVGAEMLKSWGLPDDICRAVKTHNEAHGLFPESLLAKALLVVDPLTGLIVASALVLPSKKLADLTVENVLNRLGEKSFAKGANREIIKKCQEYLDLSLEDFVSIGLKSMQEVSQELGL